MKKSVILINSISENPTPDEQDVLAQAAEVEKAMDLMGYHSERVFLGLNLSTAINRLEEISPEVVFNLVETLGGKGELIHFAPSLLESMGIPFTGSGSYAIYLSSHKLLAKKRFTELGIPTPEWSQGEPNSELQPEKKYIIKPIWEDGSVGISDKSVVEGNSFPTGNAAGSFKEKRVFLEEYIPGREFNISILGGADGPVVLPPAEIRFVDYPPGKPHILNYASKWDENSFEYHNSVRTFNFAPEDISLLQRLREISLRCWNGLGLKGYARVDFRVNLNNEPFVLEVNANPCISPDAGFIAAAGKAGLDYRDVVERIIHDAFI